MSISQLATVAEPSGFAHVFPVTHNESAYLFASYVNAEGKLKLHAFGFQLQQRFETLKSFKPARRLVAVHDSPLNMESPRRQDREFRRLLGATLNPLNDSPTLFTSHRHPVQFLSSFNQIPKNFTSISSVYAPCPSKGKAATIPGPIIASSLPFLYQFTWKLIPLFRILRLLRTSRCVFHGKHHDCFLPR